MAAGVPRVIRRRKRAYSDVWLGRELWQYADLLGKG
jgi:hypothetical protein